MISVTQFGHSVCDIGFLVNFTQWTIMEEQEVKQVTKGCVVFVSTG